MPEELHHNGVLLALLGFLAVGRATAQPSSTKSAGCTSAVVSDAASRMVLPLLQTVSDVRRKQAVPRAEPDWGLEDKIIDALTNVLEDQSPAADESVAALLGFYLGEHEGEMIEEEVLRRGARMEPLVRLYGICRPVLTTGSVPDDISWLGTLYPDVLRGLHGSIKKPLVLTGAELDLNGDGRADRIEIVFKSGQTSQKDGRAMHRGYFSAIVTLAGREPVETSLNRLLKTDMALHGGRWNLVFQDYNHDGIPDFNLGQWCEYESYCYGLLTVAPDGHVRELPVIPEEKFAYEPIVDDQANSTTKIELTESGFKCIGRDDDGRRFESVYQWDSKAAAFHRVSRTPLPADR